MIFAKVIWSKKQIKLLQLYFLIKATIFSISLSRAVLKCITRCDDTWTPFWGGGGKS